MDILSLLLLSVLSAILFKSWHLITLSTFFIGYRLKIVSGNRAVSEVQDGVYCASLYEKDQPRGLMIGRVNGFRFIAFLSIGKNEDTLYVFSHERAINDIKIDSHKLKTYNLGGNKFRPYTSGELFNPVYPEKGWQETIRDEIISEYKKSNYCSALITGSSGAGKSTMAYIIATALNGTVLNFDPTIYQLSTVLNKMKYDADHPLILLIDEIDEFLETFKCDKNKFIAVEWHNKRSYNGFFDYHERIVKPNMIIICTANKPYYEIPDQSLVRQGRYQVRINV